LPVSGKLEAAFQAAAVSADEVEESIEAQASIP